MTPVSIVSLTPYMSKLDMNTVKQIPQHQDVLFLFFNTSLFLLLISHHLFLLVCFIFKSISIEEFPEDKMKKVFLKSKYK